MLSTSSGFGALSDAKVDHYLLVVSTVFIILTLVAYCLKEFVYPIVRKIRLRYPAKAYFLITSIDRFDLWYAKQDEDEHETEILALPSHTHNLLLHVVWRPKLDFIQSGAEFSFEGDREKKPLIHYWFHPFVSVGEQTKKPGEYSGHYLDYHGNYHIEGVHNRAKRQTLTSAFIVTTRDPGIYYFKISIVADGVDGVVDGTPGAIGLRVRVEDHPIKTTKCHLHANCIIEPRLVARF